MKFMKTTLLTAFLMSAGSLAQAQSLPSDQRTNGEMVQDAFEPIRARLQESSGVLYDGRTKFEYATIVSADGYLLTKASELEGHKNITLRIENDIYEDVKIVSRDVVWDIALLKIDAENLKAVEWASDSALAHGTWVVSNGSTTRNRRRLRAGVISANSREVDGAVPVILGIGIDRKHEGSLLVSQVSEDSGAAKAGVKKGDEIIKVDGVEVHKFEDLLGVLKGKQPGQSINLDVMRGKNALLLEVELMPRPAPDAAQGRSRNDEMSGRVSKRRDSFPRILQHDTMLSEETVGGPVFTLDGLCVGINIACANRVEAFAIPSEEARSLAENMIKTARESHLK